MPEFNKQSFSIDNTEEFKLEDDSLLESFLNGDTEGLEKIDSKKESPKKEQKVSVKKDEEEDNSPEEEKEEEGKIDILDSLSNEDEEDKQEKSKDSSKEPAKEDGSSDVNQFEVISRQLYDMGIFQHEGDDEAPVAASGEELAALFQYNAQQAALRNLDSFLRSKGDDRYSLFEDIFVNGVDPKEYFPIYNRVQDFENLDISSEDAQERVVREYYSRLNWSPEKINNKVQKLKDYGDLEDEAQEIHPKIVSQDKEALEQQKLQKQQEEQAKKQNEQVYKGSVQKILTDAIKTKELSGIPITEKQAREVADFVLTPKYRLPNGDTLSEYDKFLLESKKPENIKDRIVFALLKKNGFDFSKIEKKAISKETNELFSGLKKTSIKKRTEKETQNNDDFWGSL